MAKDLCNKYAGWVRKDMFKLMKTLGRFESSLDHLSPVVIHQQFRNIKQLRFALFDMNNSLQHFEDPKPSQQRTSRSIIALPPVQPQPPVLNIQETAGNNHMKVELEGVSRRISEEFVISPLISPPKNNCQPKNVKVLLPRQDKNCLLVTSAFMEVGTRKYQEPLQENIAPSTGLVEATAKTIADETDNIETVPFGKSITFMPGSTSTPKHNPRGLKNINLSKPLPKYRQTWCPWCNHKFSSRRNLRHHILKGKKCGSKVNWEELKNQSYAVATKSNETVTFVPIKWRNSTNNTDCPECKHKFFDRKNLRRHIRTSLTCGPKVNWENLKRQHSSL